MIIDAVLIKHATLDGLMEIDDAVPLGKKYKVDLSSIKLRKGFNFYKQVVWEREMILDTVNGGYLPTELLQWEGKE